MMVRPNKFGAKRTTCGQGHSHPSKLEAKRCDELHLLQRAGEIRNLTIQPRYPLAIDGKKVSTYVADFAYFEGNGSVIEDTKSSATATPYYKLKRKLFEALYPGRVIREIYR